jgi:hypothetical protein
MTTVHQPPRRRPTPVDRLADGHLAGMLRLSPEFATMVGTPDADQTSLSDYSPEGTAAWRDLLAGTLSQLDGLVPADGVDAVTVSAMRERIGSDLDLVEAGETTGELNVLSSPIQSIRDVFNLMPAHTDEDRAAIGARLAAVPAAIAGYRRSLALRLESGPPIALRQVERCADQCDDVAGEASPFLRFADDGPGLEGAVGAARAAYGELAAFLRQTVAPRAATVDAVGRERYSRFSRHFLGAAVDVDETYEWGEALLASIVAEQEAVARELYGPGVAVAEAVERLNADPARRLRGTDALVEWMQETAEAAMEAASAFFDVPEPIRTLECRIAPSGTGAIYYTGPSEDFSRPGRMWWSVPDGVAEFTTWQEKTTVHHEGVPGHHLQIGLAACLRDSLNGWRRQGCWVPGHGEGWALYAEQLMVELGLVEEPGERMGVLDAMRLRAARVVVDIGVHLSKPAGRWGEGTWDADAAWRFLRENVAMDPSFLSFELDRYLGWPGQAPSYKVGQRIWGELRDRARAAAVASGRDFDLKEWHMRALSLGSVGLDVLREALA